MSRPVHFEIHASNPQALIDFYRGLFGWSFKQWEGGDYWLINTGPDDKPGINGGLLPRRGDVPAPLAAVNAYVITVDVDNLDATVSAATGAGGTLALPRMPVPGIGWLAYLKDPDLNMFGVMQADAEAA